MKNILRAIKLLPNYKRTLVVALLVAVVSAIIVSAIPLAIQAVINELFKSVGKGNLALHAILLPIFIWVGLRILLMGFDWVREIVEDNLYMVAVTNFRKRVAIKLERLSITYFEKHRAGQVSAVVNQSPFDFGGWLSSVVDDYTALILNALIAIVILGYKFPPIAIVVLLLAILYSWYTFRTTSRNRVFNKVNRALINDYSGVQVENISFVAHIRALGAEKVRSKLYQGLLDENQKNLRQQFIMQHRRNFVAAGIDLLLYAVPIFIFAVRAINGDQQPTDIYILSVYLGRISDASSRLSRMWNTTLQTNDKLGETLEVLENEDSVLDPITPKKIVELGVINFDNVSFKYDGSSQDAITDLTLRINKGDTVALVGRSGSGKSTITKLLLRFYDPENGNITVNNIDMRDVAQEDLRMHFGVVMQDVALFNDTVANNISVAKPKATREEVENAAKLAHAHEFISNLPDGYDTLVGERGVKLSGGEKQRVSIARAVLRNPEVVLLDEATSALDSESEQYVQEGLQKLLKGRTAIVIAHRLSTISHANKIIVMDRGKIIEQGTFEELKTSKGLFADLLAHQQL